MRKFPVVGEELEERDNQPVGIIWNEKYKGWEIGTSSKLIKYHVLSQEEFFRFKAGDVKLIFPEYNPEKHTVQTEAFEVQNNDFTNIPVTLREFTHNQIKLPFGCFVFQRTNYGSLFLKKIDITTDKYIDLENSPIDLYADYLNFRNEKERYIKLGRRPRKAALLYGAPGNSKTMEICKLAQHAEKDKFRVFFVQNNIDIESVNEFKKILEHEDNIFVLEEITERGHKTEELLSFLDGEMSWSNCYTIATTNYPEDLALNIMDRPSRFKIIKEFLPPNEKQRTKYLTMVGFPPEDITEAVKLTEGMSLDYLINIAFDAMLTGEKIQNVIKNFKDERGKLSKTFKNKMGIR